MIVNQENLIAANPLAPMLTAKFVGPGSVSFGLSEGGYDLCIAQDVWMHPFRRFKLASTTERFDMPKGLIGVVHDKSSWIRHGLMLGNTVIEPGWKGWLTLELFYFGFWPLFIPAGAGIAQVLFHRLEVPADYGAGKYQNQENRPVPSRRG